MLEAQAGTNTGVDLYQNRVILRQNNSGNMTNADLAVADNNADADITSFYTTSGNQLTMSEGSELYIWPGTTYAPGDTTRVDDIDINGVFSMASHDIFVDGSWDATGGTFTTTGHVVFTSTQSETLTSNAQAFNDLSINAGLIGYWTFDEGSGSTAFDHSGYGRHGTYVNIDSGDWVTPVDVNFANAYSLDINTTSLDEYVSIPNTTLDGIGTVTATYWMKTSKTSSSAIISGANASSNNEFLIFQGDTSTAFYFDSLNDSWTHASIADGVWHHMARGS